MAVLEEPAPDPTTARWTDKFRYVVGIIHTNYLEYARRRRMETRRGHVKGVNATVARIHCHKIIKFSDAVQDF